MEEFRPERCKIVLIQRGQTDILFQGDARPDGGGDNGRPNSILFRNYSIDSFSISCQELCGYAHRFRAGPVVQKPIHTFPGGKDAYSGFGQV